LQTKGNNVLAYPYSDLAHSRHRDYERRASTHRFVAAVIRNTDRPK